MPTLTRSCNTEATIINPDYGGLGASFGGGELAASDNTRFSSGAVLNTLNEEYDYIGGTFDLSSLPSDPAVVNGITVTMERRQNGGTAIISDEHMRLSIDGSTFVGTDKSTGLPWSATDEQVVYGGPTDTWGRTWTMAELKTATFGAFNAPKVTTAGTATAAEWDWLQISIRYNESGWGGGGSSSLKGTINGLDFTEEPVIKHINETWTVWAQFNDATLAATDATGTPAYRIYEEETGTPIVTGSMALLDDSGTTGFYSEQVAISAANGFEVDKDYVVRVTATVAGVAQAGVVAKFTVRRNYWVEVPTEITERADTPWEMLHQLWKRFFNKMTLNRDTGAVVLYNNDGTTSEVEGTNSTSGATETRGAMS